MYVRPRLRVRPRNGGIAAFTPLSLFSGGAKGAWYDPSDYSTLFQDSAGTTPVTAVEQPVGLMLDKSQSLAIGSELVTNGDFANGTTGWAAGNTATLSVVSGKLSVVNGAVSLGQGRQTITTVAGVTYKITVDFTSISASRGYVFVGTFAGDNSRFSAGPLTTSQTVTGYFTAAGTSTYISIGNADNTVGLEVQFDNVTVKSVAGNHATQATAASRPILRARYNLLTYSEQFDVVPWSATSGGTASAPTVTANQGTAPDNTNTADRLQFSLSGGTTTADLTRRIQSISTISGAAYTFSIWVKSYDGTSSYNMHMVGADGITSNVSVTGNWTRLSVTANGTGSNVAFAIGLRGGQTPANSNTADILVWGAQVVYGSSAGTYQRIAAATDYATAGFLPYLALITDDSLSTGSIDFSATDKMSVCAGITKLSDSAQAILYELSTDTFSNNGAFLLWAPSGAAAANYYARVRGSVVSNAITSATYPAPITNVATLLADISGDSVNVRVNGTSAATSTSDLGTGNFGNYPLYIGRRNNASLPFDGRIYQMVVCGKALSASELASTESFVATKTGVTL